MAKKVTVIKAAKEQKHTQEERRLKVHGGYVSVCCSLFKVLYLCY